MWEKSSCDLDRVNLQATSSFVVFIDKRSQAKLKVIINVDASSYIIVSCNSCATEHCFIQVWNEAAK